MLISTAYAQTAAAPSAASSITSMLPILAVFVIMYFLMIRPQMKRQKEHRAMLDALNVGDEVITAGGLIGKITHLNEQWAHVEIARGMEVQLQRSSIGQVLPKGTMQTSQKAQAARIAKTEDAADDNKQ